MISVQKALKIIAQRVQAQPTVRVPIQDTLHGVLAQDIVAPISLPPFRQSSMDGYAFQWSEKNVYKVIGEVQAGSDQELHLDKGEAVRIFTGAPVPNTADTVVMQEHVTRDQDHITLIKHPEKRSNVRPIGEQLLAGTRALPKGTLLNPAGIGFLTGLGIAYLETYKKPTVSILLTGDELQQAGKPLKKGQVYDSNSVTLKAALQSMGLSEINIAFIPDNYKATKTILKEHLKTSDLVLISGGISVGDYDFVQDALIDNGAQEHFYKVNQKPGKPLWFGTTENSTIFALPGNPASSLTCFYVYVLPAIRKMMGHQDIHLTKNTATSMVDLQNNFGKTLFLKGIVNNGRATPLMGQASSMLSSFAVSNALLIIPEDLPSVTKGDSISYLALPK